MTCSGRRWSPPSACPTPGARSKRALAIDAGYAPAREHLKAMK
jgi:hypothetical protein